MEYEGIKQNEIKPCHICGKGVCHSGAISASRIRINRVVVDLNAVKRQSGLEMMIGGPLAAVMGPNDDMMKCLPGETVFVCDDCAMKSTIFRLHEDAKEPARKW